MSNLFNGNEMEELKRLAQQGKDKKVSRIVDELSESSQYIEPLELILRDRDTHKLLLRTARDYSPGVEAICVEPFDTIHHQAYSEKSLTPYYEKLKDLYKLFDSQPSLVLHVNDQSSNFAVGSLCHRNFRSLTLGLACDFLKDSHVNENGKISEVDSLLLIDWYKASVRYVLEQSDESNWDAYLRPAERELERLESFHGYNHNKT